MNNGNGGATRCTRRMHGTTRRPCDPPADYSGLKVPNNWLLRIAKKSVAPATSTVARINRTV